MTPISPEQRPPDGDDAHILPLGQDGILVRFGDGHSASPQKALNFGATVEAAQIVGVTEVATSLSSVQVRFAPNELARAVLRTRLEDLLEGGTHPDKPLSPNRLWTIPACFGGADGPQLAEAATLAKVSEAVAIEQIAQSALRVLAIGFAPGQPYIGELPTNWAMPRQSGLTPQVPSGAIVVAIRQLVLFANPSPTGWRWIGSSAFLPFKSDRQMPFALRPGDRIRFAPTDATTIGDLRLGRPDGLGGATCEVDL